MLIRDRHGDEREVYRRPGDNPFRPDAGVGCPDPAAVQFAHDQLAHAHLRDEQEVEPESDFDEDVFLQDDAMDFINSSTVEIYLVKENGVEIDEVLMEFKANDGDVAAAAKRFFLSNFKKKGFDLELYTDRQCSQILEDDVLLSSVAQVYMERKLFYADPTKQEESKEFAFKNRFVNLSVKIKQAAHGTSREIDSGFAQMPPGSTKRYVSKSVRNAPFSLAEIESRLSRHFSYMFSKDMVARFFKDGDELNAMFSAKISNNANNKKRLGIRFTPEDNALLNAEVYPHILARLNFNSLFAFIDEVHDEKFLGFVMHFLSTATSIDRKRYRHFDVKVENNSDDSDEESDEGGEEEEEILPWECKRFSTAEKKRHTEAAAILTKQFELYEKRMYQKHHILSSFRMKFKKFKQRCSEEFLDKIRTNSVNYSFNANSRSQKALAFLFEHFIIVARQELSGNDGRVNVVQIKEKAWLEVGKFHQNVGKTEVGKSGDVQICYHLCGKVVVSDMPSIPPAEDSPCRTVVLPRLSTWPSLSIGLISESLGENLFVVQLISDDLQIAVWEYDETTSQVYVCSKNNVLYANMCSCGRSKTDDRCIHTAIETDEVNPHFVVAYGEQKYKLRFFIRQVIYVSGRLFKQQKAGKRWVAAVIDDISGGMLALRTIEAPKKVVFQLHFSSPHISVRLIGNGLVNSLKCLELYEPQRHAITKSIGIHTSAELFYCRLALTTDNFSSCCHRGPKNFKCPCNFCGLVTVGCKTWRKDKICLNHFDATKMDFCAKVNDLIEEFDQCFLQKRPQITNFIDAQNAHRFLQKNVTRHFGTVTLQNGKFKACHNFKFFQKLQKVGEMAQQIDFANETFSTNYHERLSTWVEDDAPEWLVTKRDDEIKKCMAKGQHFGDHLEKMRNVNQIIAKDLQRTVVDKLFKNYFNPLSNRSYEIDPSAQQYEKSIQVTMTGGMQYWVCCSFSLKRTFAICECRTFANLVGLQSDVSRLFTECMHCAGPFMGLACDRFYDAKWLVENCGGHRSEGGEELTAVLILTRIHSLYDKADTGNPLIFILYQLVMRFWYAFEPGTTYDGSTWHERWKSAPHLKFLHAFYEASEFKCEDQEGCNLVTYVRYSGPVPKRARMMVDKISIQEDAYIKEQLKNAQQVVEAMLPYNGVNKSDTLEEIQKKIAIAQNLPKTGARRGANVGSSNRSNLNIDKICTDKFSITTTTYRQIWDDFSYLRQHSNSCRPKRDFLKILFDFEAKHGTFCPVMCPNESCKQCIVLRALSRIQKGDRDHAFRIIKSVVGGNAAFADSQLQTFGELVSFLVCEHFNYFNECPKCLDDMHACRKDHRCVQKEGKFCCQERHGINFHARDGTLVPHVEQGTHCKIQRRCQYIVSPQLDDENSEPSAFKKYTPLVDAEACDAMDFFERGYVNYYPE